MFRIKFIENIVSAIFNSIAGFIGSYGIAIIITTILVKLLLLPIALKQDRSMQKMKELSPELDKIKAKYPDDKQQQNIAISELYKENKVNPAAGCLPLLIQLPIFVALYYTFMSASVPNEKFLWFFLKETDSLFTIGGFNFNLLPIISSIVMMVQQKIITPPSSDGDVAGQSMKMMTYTMPILMLFLFYRMPSGINLYYLMNGVLSIVQQMYVMRGRR